MKITITRKILLKPTPQQEKILKNTAQQYTNACNHISTYCQDNKTLSKKKIQENNYNTIRTKYNLPSQMAISTIRSVTSAYKTIHSDKNNKKFEIKPIFKKHKYDLVWNRDYSITRTGDFSINSVKGRLKITTEWSHNEQYSKMGKYGTATLHYKYNKWFINVPVDIIVDDVSIDDITNIVGVDLGLNFIATTYDSNGDTKFYSGKKVKHYRGHYKQLRSELQRKGTRSSRKRLLEIGSRENRWMNDVNHCITKALVEQAPRGTLFVLEDLTGVRSATERVRVKDRYTQVSWAFYDFRQKLEYKAKLYGHRVIVVDPKFTSQTCPKCGYVDKLNRVKRLHLFKCKACGYCSNDDRVGAMNLHFKGIQYRLQCDKNIFLS